MAIRASLLDKLDMLVADEEAEAEESLSVNSLALDKARLQQRVLSSYRRRLSGSIESGTVMDAAMVKNASNYITATANAEDKIAANAVRLEEKVTRDLDKLGSLRIERKNLQSARKIVDRENERALERRSELLMPPRPKRP